MKGEQYRQTLISCNKNYAPSAYTVREFLSVVTALGVVPGRPAIVVVSVKVRTFDFGYCLELVGFLVVFVCLCSP